MMIPLKGFALIHFATQKSDIALIQSLVENGVNINARDNNGRSPLFTAIKKERPSAQALIDLGADLNVVDTPNGDTPLLYAVRRYKEEAVIMLLKAGADVNQRDAYGNSVLHIAFKNYDLLEILLEHGVDPDLTGAQNKTVLHNLIEQSQDNRIVKLFIKHGANVNCLDEFGRTPLYYAITRHTMYYHYELIMNGADPKLANAYENANPTEKRVIDKLCKEYKKVGRCVMIDEDPNDSLV